MKLASFYKTSALIVGLGLILGRAFDNDGIGLEVAAYIEAALKYYVRVFVKEQLRHDSRIKGVQGVGTFGKNKAGLGLLPTPAKRFGDQFAADPDRFPYFNVTACSLSHRQIVNGGALKGVEGKVPHRQSQQCDSNVQLTLPRKKALG